ncbi:uncharacterized protein [Diabrotica undecimpunctata]|uniref:uncharacterized protein n=1 Tax=Diabrotica undecimpunctata TaxID=50387 RepID=UPI003B636255
MYKKVKKVAGIFNKRQIALLHDEHGKVIFEVEDKFKEWKNYITNLFEDDRIPSPLDITNSDGTLITRSEVTEAIQSSKKVKRQVLPNDILSKIYKLINDSNVLEAITAFFNTIYTSGHLPDGWSNLLFIALPKKKTAKTCTDYRTIRYVYIRNAKNT